MIPANRMFNRVALAFCLVASSLFSANVVFDLGGVIVATDNLKAAYKTGITYFLLYGFRQAFNKGSRSYYNVIVMFHAFKKALNSDRIRKRLFAFFEQVEKQNPEQIQDLISKYKIVLPTNPQAQDEHNQNLPKLMCLWLAGVPSAEIRALIAQTADLGPSFFKNQQERKLLTSMSFMIYTPQTFAQTRKPIQEGIAFANRCKQEGHTLYVLSNWDRESFDIMQQYYPSIFGANGLFKGIMLSSEAHTLKPHPSIYKHLLTVFNLQADDTVFLDDLQINIDAAEQEGIHGIFVPTIKRKPDFKTVQDKFDVWKADHHASTPEYLRYREIAVV